MGNVRWWIEQGEFTPSMVEQYGGFGKITLCFDGPDARDVIYALHEYFAGRGYDYRDDNNVNQLTGFLTD